MMYHDLAPQFTSSQLTSGNTTVSEPLAMARTRLTIVTLFFCLCFVVISGRLLDIMAFNGRAELAGLDTALSPTLHLGRGNIVDRNGELLATVLTTSSLYANPRIVIDPQEGADKLCSVLPHLNKAEVLKKLESGKGFAWIARHLTPQQKAAIINLGIPGLDFMRDEKRVYPDGNLVAHVLGYTDVDGEGIAGVEQYFDKGLKAGETLTLSIDKRAQHVLKTELLAGIAEFNAMGASGMIIDIHTGEVVAMASLPDFDPNKPQANDETLFNKNTNGIYEMGSVLKIPNTAMALETGVANLNTRYDATHPLKVGRFTIKDLQPKNSWLNVSEVFVNSSNIGSAKMALDVGPSGQRTFLQSLGFLNPPKIELPEIGAPMVPSESAWREVSAITISYGYGLSISPLQLAIGIATITNGGIMRPATLLAQKGLNSSKDGVRVISPETSNIICQLMRLVITEGTSKKAAVPGYHVAGKTGTANKQKGKGYGTKNVRASFVGVFPKKPKYLVQIMLDDPKATKETYGFNNAGWNAAPVAGRIIARVAPLLEVKPQLEHTSSHPQPMDMLMAAQWSPNTPPARTVSRNTHKNNKKQRSEFSLDHIKP